MNYHEVIMKKNTKWEKGINITVSKKAHRKISDDARKAVPRRSIRQQVNIITNLPIDL